MILSICRPANGPGTRSPGALVTGFSHIEVVSDFSSQALTRGAQPSACTAMNRGWESLIQPMAASSS